MRTIRNINTGWEFVKGMSLVAETAIPVDLPHCYNCAGYAVLFLVFALFWTDGYGQNVELRSWGRRS